MSASAESLDPTLATWLDSVNERIIAALDGEDALPGLPTAPAGGPLAALAGVFGLRIEDVDILVQALAAEVTPATSRAFMALADDSTAGRPTVATALRLAGLPLAGPASWSVAGTPGPLLRQGLLVLEDADRPLGARRLRLPDRVTHFLLGQPALDPSLAALETRLVPVATPVGDRIATAMEAGVRLVYLRERPTASGFAIGAAVFQRLDLPAIGFDLRRAGPQENLLDLLTWIAREGGILQAGLVVGPIERVTAGDVDALDPLLRAPGPVVLTGSVAWEPWWSRSVPLALDAEAPERNAAMALWAESLGEERTADALSATEPLRLTPEQIAQAGVAARLLATADGVPVGQDHVRGGARQQSAGRLESLASRRTPRATLDDLVLPPAAARQVRHVIERGRNAEQVLVDWGMSSVRRSGQGTTVLFAGSSGTGKTLSAEVIAGELGVDLYTIDLSTVVDKYVGETEKNLERVFDEAEGINGVLFFDEADALFGKRSAVSDAHDRYANVETAYLLQRMERFDGIAILATNLRANIDEAFTRRIDVIVVFPDPDPAQRLLLWQRHLPDSLPRDGDLDLALIADGFEVSGGDIANIATTAAHLAAAAGRGLRMDDLVLATASEFRKAGRLFDPKAFGDWSDLVDD